MAKKPRTEKQLANDKRLAELAKARREAAETIAAAETVLEAPAAPVETPEPTTTVQTEQDYAELLRNALEAISNLTAQKTAEAPTNKLSDRYSVNPDNYVDPTDRLANEASLGRFGFKENYELRWSMAPFKYQDVENKWHQEPRFTLDLIRVIFDEETGEKTNGRYLEYRLIQHEDPDSAIMVATDNGVDVDSFSEKDFLNEMRYIQARDWLFGLPNFFPQKAKAYTNTKDMVIGGKMVQYFEKSDDAEKSSSLPFGNLDSSKKL